MDVVRLDATPRALLETCSVPSNAMPIPSLPLVSGTFTTVESDDPTVPSVPSVVRDNIAVPADVDTRSGALAWTLFTLNKPLPLEIGPVTLRALSVPSDVMVG